jgi:hypothetical protein
MAEFLHFAVSSKLVETTSGHQQCFSLLEIASQNHVRTLKVIYSQQLPTEALEHMDDSIFFGWTNELCRCSTDGHLCQSTNKLRYMEGYKVWLPILGQKILRTILAWKTAVSQADPG